MGNIQTPTEGKHKSANVRIRNELDLFANVIHAKTHPSIETRHKNIDIILIRENTQGEYSGLEHETVPGVIETLKIITQASSKKIAKFAFNYAKDHDRKLVTCIHKANIMKEGDGLFLKTIREIHARPQNCHLQLDDMIVDNTCMQLVKSPEQFDVMVLPNLYGNVVANICCGITGGSGVNAGGNYNKDKSLAVFEVAVRCAGVYDRKQDEANPMAFLKAGQLLLQHCDLPEHAKIINDALQHVYFDEKIHTPDLGGDFGTKDVIKAIDSHISKSLFEKNTVISGNYFTGRPHGY